MSRSTLAGLCLAALLAAAPLHAQEEVAPDAPPAAPAHAKSKTSKAGAKTPKKAPAKPAAAAKKPAPPPVVTVLAPIPDGGLEILDQALGSYLTDQHKTAPIAQEPPEEGPDLTAMMASLDQTLEARMQATRRQPATPPGPRVTAGLGAVLRVLKQRGGQEVGPPTNASPEPASPPAPATEVPTESPPPDATQAALPPTAPPPTDVPGAIPGSAPEGLVAPVAPAHRYVLSRIVVSRDGGPDQELPVPSGGDLRPVPLTQRGGNPPVDLRLLLRVPAEVVLGQSTQITAQASAQAAGAAGELSLLDEVVDTVRAPDGSEAAAATGTVTFSFMKRVGGIFAYQQSFAGSSPAPARSILLNWTDREAALEMPFAWVTTSPSPVSIRGKLVYAPASRP